MPIQGCAQRLDSYRILPKRRPPRSDEDWPVDEIRRLPPGLPTRPAGAGTLSTPLDSSTQDGLCGPQLLPSPPRVRLDRRDPDRGRPRGGGAIRGRLGDRARLSAGALAAAARARAVRDRDRAGHRALHPRRAGLAAAPRGGLPRDRLAPPVGARARAFAAAILSRRGLDRAAGRAAHAQRRVFQAHRRDELHPAAR